MAQTRGVIKIISAPAGSGKTYRRGPHYLVNEFLPNEVGIHWSNFPLFPEKIARVVAKRTGVDAAVLQERIRLIPEDVLQTWRTGDSGPWDYFKDIDMTHAHIALDEFHEFCGVNKPKELQGRYSEWFGQIRHRSASIEVISQSPEKIAKVIHHEAGGRLSLVNSEDRRDPWCKVLFGDWYELRAAWILREYMSCVWEIEYRNSNGKWVEEDTRIFWFDKFYFDLYDSYSRPADAGQGVKGTAKKREFEKRTRLGLTGWFIRRNWIRLGWRVAAVAAFIWFCCGGFEKIIVSVNTNMQNVVKARIANNKLIANQRAATHPATTSQPSTMRAVGFDEILPMPSLVVVPASAPAIQRGGVTTLPVVVAAAATSPAAVDIKPSWLLVVVTPDSATFSDGQTYSIGDVFIAGPEVGELIEFINFPRHFVRLSNGKILTLSVPVVSSSSGGMFSRAGNGSSTRPAIIQGFVSVNGSGGSPTTRPATRAAPNDGGAGGSARNVPANDLD